MTLECESLHESVPGAARADLWAACFFLIREQTRGDGLAVLADWVETSIRGAGLSPPAQNAA